MKFKASGLVGRARMLSAFFVVVALLLTARLYFVQIVHGEEYRASAEGQYVERAESYEDRSDIFFTEEDGDLVAAAVMQRGWRIAISPRDIEDPGSLFEELSDATNIDRERFFASAAKTNDPYEEVAFRLADEEAALIRKKKLPGVILVPDQWRSYPGGDLGAHVVGFVGYHGDRRVGVYGLERSWEDTLTKTTSGLYVNPFAELFTNVESALSFDPAGERGSIITTIEPQVEARLESTLDDVMKTYSPTFAGGIVMDPKTGEIVAMAARPAFDPNTYNTVDDPGVFTNPLVENVYEMGSIMKPLTVAAGIDAGVITPKTTYDDVGCIDRSGKKICNYDKRARGVVDVQEILSQSLNVGATFVAEKMGHNVFREYVHAYGLGEKSDIDLPNEARGIVRAIDRGYDVDYASASFGQGIAVTAVEMTRGLAALANEGVLPYPHIVKGIRLESGVTRSLSFPEGPRALKAEAVQDVSSMLVKVFDEALLGGVLKQEHYSIAAKTGTAQIATPGGGGYYADRYLHSFFGYFPAHDPRFIVFLMAYEPHGVEYASASLARPFADIAKYLINYYNIAPDR